MIEINIQRIVGDIHREFRGVTKEQVELATARSINRAVTSARATAIREISKIYNIDKKFFADKKGNEKNRYNALVISRASKYNLTGKVNAYGRAIPLIAFPYEVTATGVTVHVKKGESKEFKHAFLARMKSGHESIFAKGTYSKGAFVGRHSRVRPFPANDTPITQILTTSIRSAVMESAVLSAMKIKAEDTLQKRIRHEISRLLV